MDDLAHRDFSGISVENMSPDERRELKRRFEEFIGAMRGDQDSEVAELQTSKRIEKWDPLRHGAKRKATAA